MLNPALQCDNGWAPNVYDLHHGLCDLYEYAERFRTEWFHSNEVTTINIIAIGVYIYFIMHIDYA